MFLRHKLRRKDGKEHRYWSIVENRRVSGGRTVQRHVLYLARLSQLAVKNPSNGQISGGVVSQGRHHRMDGDYAIGTPPL